MLFDKRFIKEAGVIVGLSFVIGLAVNASLIRRYLRGELDRRFISDTEYRGIIQVTLAETEDLFAGGRGLFVDARPRKDFGTGHIPGAVNLPLEEAEPEVKAFAERIPSDRALVIYCGGGDCLAGLSLAKLLSAQGVKEIRVFLGGWAEWTKAGLPAESGYDQK